MKIKITEAQSKMLNEGFRDEQNSASINFRPVVGMENMDLKSPGYKGRIEHVGEDYFVLRSARGGEPVLIKPFQYHGFINYKSDNIGEQPIEDGINPITGYDVDKESPGYPKRKPYSTTHTPTTYSSTQIEKSRTDIRNNRDSQNY